MATILYLVILSIYVLAIMAPDLITFRRNNDRTSNNPRTGSIQVTDESRPRAEFHAKKSRAPSPPHSPPQRNNNNNHDPQVLPDNFERVIY